MTNAFASTDGAAARPLTSRQILGRSRCQVCRHPDKWRVELLKAGSASLDSLAKKFDLAPDAIWRHWNKHVSAEMKAGYLAGPMQLQELAAKAADSGASVLDNLNAVRTVLMGHLATMTEAGDGRGAAYVAGRLTATLETIARVSGELGDIARSTVYNTTITNIGVITQHPGFARVQIALLNALAGHPEARRAVVDALREFESGKTPAVSTRAPAGPVLELEATHVDG
jgi:hypothetical protein